MSLNFSEKTDIVIALDAMGGDNAPYSVLKGAELALSKRPNLKFMVYGDKNDINSTLNSLPRLKNSCQIVHTSEVISNEDKPSAAIRTGRSSSMALAINAVRDNEAKAIVSAGNTGALMALSKILLKTLPGIDRPAIGGLMPHKKGLSVMLDLGANVSCTAENLYEFAIMGAAFARAVLGNKNPSIGLLNVGSEKNKGHEVIKTAATLIEETTLNFYGNIEGDDIGKGTVDVVVTDGFTGNIALKTAEGTVRMYADFIKKEFGKSLYGKLALLMAAPVFASLKRSLDPRLYNGAMLLGLNGIVVKSHGGTDEIGFASAIEVAFKLAKNKINDHISQEISESEALVIDEDIDIDSDL
jgi:glycerol-3-phosphate acyltransferase PlsX